MDEKLYDKRFDDTTPIVLVTQRFVASFLAESQEVQP